ncbi:hypothetical protein KVR01_013104 [Diaporthe batatas]|uniref:uncharacterized protein n=1 Tax=Diaporthe batatas TaxID=748121 RepID=UPI001D053D85|nr:uncharacterized protein KVR01_013104 [Diaporthe batatas]KAG8157114.1 hypothetical protein KVR01_013104 [Diaporthe batatas]
MPSTPSNSRPSSSSGNKGKQAASPASSVESFEFSGSTTVDKLDPHFGTMMKSKTTLRKLKTAGGLGEKAKKLANKTGKPVKVKGGLIKGKAHPSSSTADGMVISVRMQDQSGEYLDTGKMHFETDLYCEFEANPCNEVHLKQDGQVTYQQTKADQKSTGKRDGVL